MLPHDRAGLIAPVEGLSGVRRRGTAPCERAVSALAAVDPHELDDYFDERETQLAPLLYWHLKRRGALGALAGRAGHQLERRYHRNLAKNALLEHGLSRVLARFHGEGIEVALLKGASVFSAELAPIRNAFVLSDIDLLVRPEDLERAVDVLVRDGYSPTHGQIGAHRSKAVPARSRRRDQDRSPLRAVLGEGWRLPRVRPRRSLASERAAESLHGYPVATLAPEDQLSHRLVHDAIGHGGPILATSTARLYYLCLLVDFYRDRIDWHRFLQMLQPKQSDRLLCPPISCTATGSWDFACHRPSKRGDGRPTPTSRSSRRSSHRIQRLADYGHRTSLALLTGRTRRERVKKAGAAARSSIQRARRNPRPTGSTH